MMQTRAAWALTLSILAGWFTGCVRDGRFECGEAAADGPRLCDQGGRCIEGSCAYADAECASGWRFASHAEPGGECTVCGGSEQECCTTSPACEPGLACTGGVCGCLVEVAAGRDHVCVLDTTGSMQCWGNNETRQVSAIAEDVVPPIEIELSGVKTIAAGDDHTCAATEQGEVWCWGANTVGELGDGRLVGRGEPAPVPGLADVVALDNGGGHTCAATSAGDVWCWGWNSRQQLGQTGLDHSAVPLQVASLPPVDRLALGFLHSCALAGTDIYCWGDNSQRQLAADPETLLMTAAPRHIVADATALVAGHTHSCYARDGLAYCWPFSDGTPEPTGSPVQVRDLSSATPVAAGYAHFCAVDQGALFCFGDGDEGQLGDGAQLGRSSPVRVVGIERASTAASAGHFFTCALADGALWCWGDNRKKTIFPSDAVEVPVPIRMPVECR